MIDLKTVVEVSVPFLHEPHLDITKAAVADVEATRHTNGFDKTTEPAALLVFNLLLDPICHVLPVGILFFPRLDREFLAITVQSVLVKLTVVVIDAIAHLIFKCQSNHVTGHERHHNIYVYMELVGIVGRLDRYH